MSARCAEPETAKPPPGRNARVLVKWRTLGMGSASLAALLLLGFPLGFYAVWDEPIDAAARSLDWQPVVLLARAFDALGSIEAVALLLAILVVGLVVQKRWRDACLATALVLLTEVVVGSLKVLMGRARPLDSVLEVGGASFPSGHAARGAILAVLFAWWLSGVLVARPGLKRGAYAGLASFAGAMALSRIVLHVHWLTDVVVGALLGIALGSLAVAFGSPRSVPVTTRVEVKGPEPVVAPRLRS